MLRLIEQRTSGPKSGLICPPKMARKRHPEPRFSGRPRRGQPIYTNCSIKVAGAALYVSIEQVCLTRSAQWRTQRVLYDSALLMEVCLSRRYASGVGAGDNRRKVPSFVSLLRQTYAHYRCPNWVLVV